VMNDHQMGLVVPPGSEKGILEGIILLLNNTELRSTYGRNAVNTRKIFSIKEKY